MLVVCPARGAIRGLISRPCHQSRHFSRDPCASGRTDDHGHGRCYLCDRRRRRSDRGRRRQPDRTHDYAEMAGAKVIVSPRGRGSQMAADAQASVFPVLWFIHADTVPPSNAGAIISATLADARVVGGHFRPRFDGEFTAARFFSPGSTLTSPCSD